MNNPLQIDDGEPLSASMHRTMAHKVLPPHSDECSSSDDAKVRKVDLLALKHLEWRLHLERLVLSPVFEVYNRHEQLPPNRRWGAAICEHAPNHDAQNPPPTFGHTDLLRRVGGCELLDNTSPISTAETPPGVLAALFGMPTNYAATKGNDRSADEQLKRLESLVLASQQVNGGPLGEFVGYLADVLVAAFDHWREGPVWVPVTPL